MSTKTVGLHLTLPHVTKSTVTVIASILTEMEIIIVTVDGSGQSGEGSGGSGESGEGSGGSGESGEGSGGSGQSVVTPAGPATLASMTPQTLLFNNTLH
jgi:hypothetical protein